MAQLGKSPDARTRVAKPKQFRPKGSRPHEAENQFAELRDRKPSDPLAFWRTKTLEEMTRDEWESLCDGCGRCCLLKLQDEDTDEIYVTRVSCRLLDVKSCQCIDYGNRFDHVPDCVTIDAAKVRTLPWLPETCAYRRVAEGHDLEWWHPLVSGSPDTVHEAGISVRGLARSEAKINENDLWRYIIDPPGEAK